jgi:short chain dehydrogenase
MDLQVAGKSALITGASKGIGRAAAQALAAEGCNVILVSRSAGDLAAAREQIRQSCDVKVNVVAADLSDSSKVDELARDFPNIDILVNNAGAIPGGTLLDIDEKTWRKAWDLKVFGYINMCRAFYALMKPRRRGVIVNVTGNAAQTHDPELAGNAALTAFSQSLGSVSPRDWHQGDLGQPWTGGDRPPDQLNDEKGTGSDRECRKLARASQAAAVCARLRPGGSRRYDRFSRFRALHLQQRLRRDHRCRFVRAKLQFLSMRPPCRI